MKYGFLNLCFDKDLRTVNKTHRDVFKWASENGFDGVEIYLPTLSELSWLKIQGVKKALTDYSLKVSQVSHANPFLSRDETSQRYAKRYYTLAAEIASVLEAPFLRATSGMKLTDVGEALKHAAEGLGDILDIADDYDLTITLENHPGIEEKSSTLASLFQTLKSPRVKFNFDTVNSMGVHEDPVEVLRRFSNLLVHVHACDAYARNVHEKTVIGMGDVPWKGVMEQLKALRYKGFLSIEYFGDNPQHALIESMNNLKHLEV